MKNFFKNKKEYYKYGGLYGSSGSYIINKISDDYKNTIVVLNNNLEVINFKDEINNFNSNEKTISMFLDVESFPYDNTITDINVISERLKTYYRLVSQNQNIIITSYAALCKRIIPKNIIESYFYKINMTNTYNELLSLLKFLKYERTDQIANKGEFSIRGPIIDIYNPIADTPIRIVFDRDIIDSVKTFNINTQRTIEQVVSFVLSPSREILINKEIIENYKSECPRYFDDEYLEDIEYQKITNEIHYNPTNNIMPLFYEKLTNLMEVVSSEDNIILSLKNIENEVGNINKRYQEYYKKNKEIEYILNPNMLLLDKDDFAKSQKKFFKIELSLYKVSEDHLSKNSSIRKLPSLLINNTFKDPFKNFKNYITLGHKKVLIYIKRSSLKIELSKVLFGLKLKYEIKDDISSSLDSKTNIIIINGELNEGFIDYDQNIIFISCRDIFGDRSINIPKKSNNKLVDNYINDISTIEIDSPIVHDNYGVGRYKGLINMNVEGIETELIKIEYYNEDILYIPVTSINLLKKYSGHTGLNIPLHSLGTDHWIKIKNRAKNKINDIAVELLEIESKRQASSGFHFINDVDEYQKFKDDFPYAETEDQSNTIKEVIADMCSDKPMDRLICGDVGFGKTEIIMRAAFISSINQAQTMILVPTTILTEQHYKSFIKRFMNTPINIGKISRMQSAREKKQVIEKIESGELDIVIGTHALLSKLVIFKNLKLLIIDEEHKFGVSHKEKIKKYKFNIDVITLTATPIPRTLNSALSQIKDLSIIETPPQNRKIIVTRITEWNEEIISDAIDREVQRGGQIYYVHNEIASINDEIIKIKKLNNDIKVGVIHGQLDVKIIETEMNKFLGREYDLIICTSIIESGLDIQNVNTIIINNSNRFGLSQLHQIRGRVGRTNRQAYAYLVIPKQSLMTKDAVKRLEAIDSIDSLGGGLELATHDLEIRGAGELLGEEQSGQIYEIGYAMFTDMLNKSIDFLKSGGINHIEDIEIDIDKSCLITQDYINDIFVRLKYYKKISACENINEIELIKDEMVDIYGPIPDYLNNLIIVSVLKMKLRKSNIKYIKIIGNKVMFDFINKSNIKIDKILGEMDNLKIKVHKNNMLEATIENEILEDQCNSIFNIVETLR